MRRHLLRFAALLVLCACSSSSKSPDAAVPSVPDASPDIAAVPSPDIAAVQPDTGVVCRALGPDELQAAAGGLCPPTVSEIADLPCGRYEMRASGACAPEYDILRRTVDMTYVACYYAASTGKLVGALRSEDVPMFCNNTDRTILAGQTPVCTEADPESFRCIPDGGAKPDGAGPTSPTDGGTSPTDSSPVDASGYCPASTPDGGPLCCSSDLDQIKCSGEMKWCCPPTTADLSDLPCGSGETRYLHTCSTSHGVVVRNFGVFVVSCYYASATGDLVGARQFNDTPMFCSKTSRTVFTGEQPACDFRPESPSCVRDGGT